MEEIKINGWGGWLEYKGEKIFRIVDIKNIVITQNQINSFVIGNIKCHPEIISKCSEYKIKIWGDNEWVSLKDFDIILKSDSEKTYVYRLEDKSVNVKLLHTPEEFNCKVVL